MYKNVFGLIRNPFDISPDPYFFYTTAHHNEALASLVHGVLRHKGFMVLTGEVGTGKTLVIRCLMEILRQQDIDSANVFNPGLSALEFLRYIMSDLGLKLGNQDKGSLLLQLNSYLIGRYRNKKSTVLVVDEAQHLNQELLEEVRLLTNVETSEQKLLQIVLAGQPELDAKLDSPQLRQLKQRIAFRCHLKPLQEPDTRQYVLVRMQRAGAGSRAGFIFPDQTIAALYNYSRGIPRLINTICENALIAAYAQKESAIRPETIDEVARDLRLKGATDRVSAGHAAASEQAVAVMPCLIAPSMEQVTGPTLADTRFAPKAKIV